MAVTKIFSSGMKKIIKKSTSKSRKGMHTYQSKKLPGGGQFEHNYGKMVPSRKTKGLMRGQQRLRLRYTETPPNFKLFKNPPGKKGPKRAPSFKISKSSSGFQKPILKGGQLKAKTKAVRQALTSGKVDW